MKLYICNNKEMKVYNLPVKTSDDFVVVYETLDHDNKALITLKQIEGNWYLQNDDNVDCITSKESKIQLKLYCCYKLKIANSSDTIVLFCMPLNDKLYKVANNDLKKITIGKSKNNIICFNHDLVADNQVEITKENQTVLNSIDDDNYPVYINKIKRNNCKLKSGDIINIFNLKIVWMDNFMLINNPLGQVVISMLKLIEEKEEKIEIIPTTEEEKNVQLYNSSDYFYHVPRLRGKIVDETFTIDSPPASEQKDSMPLILTIGSSLVMVSSTFMMGFNVFNNLYSGAEFIKVLPQIVMMVAMVIGSLLIPLISKKYQKKKALKREKLRISKYSQYLEDKKKELEQMMKKNSTILQDSYLSCEECENIIKLRNSDLWRREINDDEFLALRLGIGRIKSSIRIDAPSEHFTLDEDQLLQKVYDIENENKYLEKVPITINLKNTPIISILFNCNDIEKYMNYIFVQLMALHSPNELNIVIFADGKQINNWSFFKNLPHCWSDDKKVRYYASNLDNAKIISNHLTDLLNERRAKKDNKEETDEQIPYYLLITDNYKKFQNIQVIHDIVKKREDLGISLLCMDSFMQNVPANSDYFIQIYNEKGDIVNREEGLNSKIEFKTEEVTDLNMVELVKVLANIPVLSKEEAQSLPNVLPFLNMFNVSKIEQLNILNRWSQNNPVVSLETPVGVQTDGELFMLDLHEKAHGPHGLVAGMTGSGKSEFIVTYILSMALNFHPYEVQFVLIDYKGGGLAGAFENRETNTAIPHLAGTITNLDVSEMNRTLVSIQSELKRRQRVFNDVRDRLGEGTIDIYKYQKLYREGIINEPMPHLFIISDEFAELKQQQPEFMQQLISAARIGRSLGVHLILATQKPSGVVNDQIWSNAKFKVCLKVQTRSDSQEMLKKPDAASIKEVGRFFLQVGYDDFFEIGQSAWSGAKYYPSERIIVKLDETINFVDEVGYVTKSYGENQNIGNQKDYGEQLTNLVRYICELGNREGITTKKLWLDAIPAVIDVDKIKQKYNYKPTPYLIAPVIGEYDEPENQRQSIINLNLTNNGNTAIFGIVGSGKEDLLNTIIWSSIVEHTPEEVNIYILDFGSGSLKSFANMPHVGDVITQDQTTKVEDFYKMIDDEIEYRKDLFSDYAGSYTEYINNSGNKLPLMLVILNQYEAFCETNMRLSEKVQYIYRDAPKYGIVFVLTSIGITGIRGRMLQNFNNKICLQLPNETDYKTVINTRKKIICAKFVGRGIIEYNDDIFEFQTASFCDKKNIHNVLREVSKQLIQAYNGYKAISIPTIPEIVYFSKMIPNINDIKQLPLGYDLHTKRIINYNFMEKKLFSIITEDMTDERLSFVISLIKELTYFSNIDIRLIDLVSAINENIDNVKLINKDFDKFIQEMNKEVSNQNESLKLYIFFGIGDIKNNISSQNNKILEKIMQNEDQNVKFIFVDTYFSYKSILVESWYLKLSDSIQGVWLGENIIQQKALIIKMLDSEDRNIPIPHLGYYIKDGKYNVFKYMVDFVEEMDEK